VTHTAVKFWFVHSGEVSLREQIVRQVSLGVLSGELAADTRLPSTRELARRFGIHPNTVSAAYVELQEEGLIRARKGVGVFVRSSPVASQPELTLDDNTVAGLLEWIVRLSRQSEMPECELRRLFEDALCKDRRCVLVEWEPELAAIVQYEIREAGGSELELCLLKPDQFASELATNLRGGRALVLPSKFEPACAALPQDAPPLLLRINPIAGWMAERLPQSREHLVAVASGWPRLLENAHPALIAAGFHPDAIFLRDARQPGWTAGLSTAAGVVCDSLTASRLPPGTRSLVYRLLTADCLREVCELSGHCDT
jgi:DNA-binding transcriptional regulator YhcF (GntR family)